MADEHYEDVSLISNIINETESYFESDQQMKEVTETDSVNTIQNSEMQLEEQTNEETNVQTNEEPKLQVQKPEFVRSTKLPVARIKSIMKMDPDVSVLSADAVFLVTKATELFLETIAKETYAYTTTNKRKVISKKDFDIVVNKVDCLCFLEGAMDF